MPKNSVFLILTLSYLDKFFISKEFIKLFFSKIFNKISFLIKKYFQIIFFISSDICKLFFSESLKL